MTTLAVTGYMGLTADSVPLVRAALDGLLRGYAGADLVGVSCIAAGADALFAEAVVNARGRLVVVVPSRDYRERKAKPGHAAVFDRPPARRGHVSTSRAAGPACAKVSPPLLEWGAAEDGSVGGVETAAVMTSRKWPSGHGCAKITHMDAARSWAEVGERIAEARLAAGLSQGDLAARVELDRTALVRIEAGDRRITALELFRLAEALGVPLAHLVSRPPRTLVSRRSALDETADEASRERYRLDAQLEEHARRAEWLVEQGFLSPPEPDPAVQRMSDTIDPVALGIAARRAVGCPSGPLGAMADVLERAGLYLTAVDEEAEGASLLLQGYGVAVISARAQPGRRRWTAAHELGHHLMQDEYHSDAGVAAGRDERERLIDQFVEEFLLPAADVRRFWAQRVPVSEPRFVMIDLSASYRVSWSAVVNRLRHLDLIDSSDARRSKADVPVLGDFLAVRGSQPIPDLEVGVTGAQWRRAALTAWSQGAVTAPRAVELLYGAVAENELPSRNLEECLP